MLAPYRRVLALPGAFAFSLSGLFGRLPISMVSLGIVVLVSTRTGSYSLAGSISAAYLIANAAAALFHGRLADRVGQRRSLPWAILLFATAMGAMMYAVESGLRAPLPHVFAAVAGAALPQVGSCVRARWSLVVSDKRQLQTAFAWEAVVDETVFVLGPTLVTLLATGVHPLAGLLTAVVSGLVGTLALAAQTRTEPPAARESLRRHEEREGVVARAPMGWRVLGPLAASAVMVGGLFGGIEVATVAFAEEQGSKPAAGVLLAVLAFGSLLSGLVYGAVDWHATNAVRYRWAITALALAMLPLPFVDGFLAMGVLQLLAGLAISPTLVASIAWVEETVPAYRLTEGISVMSTGLAAGVAPGAALTGVVIDQLGASASYWVPAVAGVVAAGIAFAPMAHRMVRVAA